MVSKLDHNPADSPTMGKEMTDCMTYAKKIYGTLSNLSPIRTLDPFVDMTHILPEKTYGKAELEHFEVSEQESKFTALREAVGHPGEFVPAGKYVKLCVNGQMVMTDTRMEQMSNLGVVQNSTGRVLIAGLGLGMILVPILKKPDVKSVTVVELSPDVISLVGPFLRDLPGGEKLQLVQGNIFSWVPDGKTKYNTIYFDIWPNICADNLKGMRQLFTKFRKYKARGAWMDAWMQERLGWL